MGWTVEDMPDQSGRIAIVTGASGGLGLEMTRALALRGAHVVMAVRDPHRGALAEQEVRDDHPGSSVEVRELDLASLESISRFAAAVTRELERLDLLVNNAGVMGIPPRETVDGFEMQFGVNHLGHHALTGLLLPLLVATRGSRVVSVTSTGRHLGRPVDPANPHLRGAYEPWRAYGQSKLANVHFALGLQERLERAGAPTQSLVAHPGLSHTELQKTSVRETGGGTSQRFFAFLARHTGMSPARGALAILRAATDPGASGGELYTPRFANFGSPVRRPLLARSRDTAAIERLFEVSTRETGVSIDVGAAVRQAERPDDEYPEGTIVG